MLGCDNCRKNMHAKTLWNPMHNFMKIKVFVTSDCNGTLNEFGRSFTFLPSHFWRKKYLKNEPNYIPLSCVIS